MSVLAALSNQVKELGPAFILYTGDLEPNGFTTAQIEPWTDAMNGNNSNGMFDITFPVRGNHDEDDTAGWQEYFDIAGVAEEVGADQFSTLTENLTYSFDYGNARFIGIDVVGGAELISANEITWLDNRLNNAENNGLTHAFIFFHGPFYLVDGYAPCSERICDTPASLVSLAEVLNRHPIVSAIFHAHEHVQSYVHIDSSRVPEVTHPFEEFITGSAGSTLYDCDKPYRSDYCGEFNGFAAIEVDGTSFTVNIYRMNTTAPVKTFYFDKP